MSARRGVRRHRRRDSARRDRVVHGPLQVCRRLCGRDTESRPENPARGGNAHPPPLRAPRVTRPSLGSIVFVVRLRTRDEMGTGPIFARHRRVAFLAAVAALATLATVVDAATPDELREERREVQAQAAELASEVDAATADVADLEVALAPRRPMSTPSRPPSRPPTEPSSTPTSPGRRACGDHRSRGSRRTGSHRPAERRDRQLCLLPGLR